MKEEDRCWCGSMLKDKPHNCIGTKSRVEGLLTEIRLLHDAIDKSNVALEEAVMMKDERDSLKLQMDKIRPILDILDKSVFRYYPPSTALDENFPILIVGSDLLKILKFLESTEKPKSECGCYPGAWCPVHMKDPEVGEKQKCLQEREDGSPCEGFIPCPRHFREQNMKDYLEKRPEESRKNYCPGCDGSRHAGPCEGE